MKDKIKKIIIEEMDFDGDYQETFGDLENKLLNLLAEVRKETAEELKKQVVAEINDSLDNGREGMLDGKIVMGFLELKGDK